MKKQKIVDSAVPIALRKGWKQTLSKYHKCSKTANQILPVCIFIDGFVAGYKFAAKKKITASKKVTIKNKE